MHKGSFEQNRIDIAVVNENRHGIKLVPEHITAAGPRFTDKVSSQLNIRGKMGFP